jgi:probable rRNA maturation factor
MALRIAIAAPCRLVPLRRRSLSAVLRRICLDHGRDDGLLSLVIVDDPTIQRLNREFLGHDYATDAITFPLDDGAGSMPDGPFGEIVVSAETARREARRRGGAPERELALYAIHGALHLAGYDDAAPAAKRRMRARERRYLALFDASIQPPPRRSSPS